MSSIKFHDRADAGRQLATRLESLRGETPLLVLGIAPNGVPIAYAVAVALGAPLEAWVARQLHAAGDPHRHVGALAEGHAHGHPLERAAEREIDDERIEALAVLERASLDAQAARVHQHHPRASMRNHTVIVVDDGLATGATLRATVRAIRQEKPHRVVVAVPVASAAALARVERYVDGIVCLHECGDLQSIGASYETHEVVDDATVATILARRHLEHAPAHH